MALLKANFRPEFLNRMDDIIFFKPLTRGDMDSIIDIQLAGLKARLKERSLALEITPEAKSFMINSSYDPLYGARPLKRFIQGELETMVAKEILSGELSAGSRMKVDTDGERLILSMQ